MAVGVLLVVEEGTFAGAVEGGVSLRDDDPVPTEGLEVDDQGVATTAQLGARLVTVEVEGAALAVRGRLRQGLDLQVGQLESNKLLFSIRNSLML